MNSIRKLINIVEGKQVVAEDNGEPVIDNNYVKVIRAKDSPSWEDDRIEEAYLNYFVPEVDENGYEIFASQIDIAKTIPAGFIMTAGASGTNYPTKGKVHVAKDGTTWMDADDYDKHFT